MNTRNEYENDWTKPAQEFKPLTHTNDGMTWRGPGPMAERRQYTASDVGNAYTDGVRCGWIGAAAFYAIGTVLLILTFHWLGVR